MSMLQTCTEIHFYIAVSAEFPPLRACLITLCGPKFHLFLHSLDDKDQRRHQQYKQKTHISHKFKRANIAVMSSANEFNVIAGIVVRQ